MHNAVATFAFAFLLVVLPPLDVYLSDDPAAAIIVQGVGQCFLALLIFLVLLAPKLAYAANGMLHGELSTQRRGTTSDKASEVASVPLSSMKCSAGTEAASKTSSVFPQTFSATAVGPVVDTALPEVRGQFEANESSYGVNDSSYVVATTETASHL